MAGGVLARKRVRAEQGVAGGLRLVGEERLGVGRREAAAGEAETTGSGGRALRRVAAEAEATSIGGKALLRVAALREGARLEGPGCEASPMRWPGIGE